MVALRAPLGVRAMSSWPLRVPHTVALVGAPQQYGQPQSGVHKGPALLRAAGMRQIAAGLRWHVEDLGDVDMETTPQTPTSRPARRGRDARHAATIGAGSRRLFDACRAAHEDGRFVLTMGGDHSIALGTVAAACAARPDTRVLWVDAHADANSPGTSPSGNMHGMPLAFLLGLVEAESLDEDATYFDWLLEKPFLSPERLAYVGLRDVDDDERCALRGLAARGTYVSSMHDVDKYGIGRVVDEALAHLGYDGTDEPPAPLHLSFDVDVCDPLIAPATGTAVRGGLSFREAHFVCEAAAMTGALGSLDIVEVNESLSDVRGAEDTVQLATGLVASALGDRIF